MRTPTRTSRVVVGSRGRLTRPLLVAALAAGLVVAGSTSAQGQSITDADAAADMALYAYENGETHPAPNQIRNDVLRTTLNHGATRISMRVKYAELRRLGEGHSQYLQMVTNEGIRRGLDVVGHPGNWAGSAVISRERGEENKVRCAIRHSIDYTRNVIAANFPRRCVGNPRWVKFRVVAQRMGEPGLYFDDALRDKPFLGEFLGENPVQSRRVYRASSH